MMKNFDHLKKYPNLQVDKLELITIFIKWDCGFTWFRDLTRLSRDSIGQFTTQFLAPTGSP